MIINPTSRP